jgi:hypothetical protein
MTVRQTCKLLPQPPKSYHRVTLSDIHEFEIYLCKVILSAEKANRRRRRVATETRGPSAGSYRAPGGPAPGAAIPWRQIAITTKSGSGVHSNSQQNRGKLAAEITRDRVSVARDPLIPRCNPPPNLTWKCDELSSLDTDKQVILTMVPIPCEISTLAT